MTIALAPDPSTDIANEYLRRGCDRLSDTELVAHVASTLSTPRSDPADSFVLHAPLELMARSALLPYVRPAERDLARLRVFALGAQFEAFGPPVGQPVAGEFASVSEATARLVSAIDAGDLDVVDRAAGWLGRAAQPAELRVALAADIVPRLSGAAHGSIFLHHLPRVAPRGEISGELLRQLAREVARYPDWRLHWIEPPRSQQAVPAEQFVAAIAAVPYSGPPDSTFIYPLMSQIDHTGTAAEHLTAVTGGADIAERGRALLRMAAWSMLLESDDHAPYGWSHCLTMPQAVLGLADGLPDPSTALAVAATYVIGFRSSLAHNSLDPVFPWSDPRAPWDESLQQGADLAAAAVWHAPEGALPPITTAIVTRAATSHDAHLVKYTLACLDAAAADPTHRRLFLTAAASLVGWWAEHGDPTDPLAP